MSSADNLRLGIPSKGRLGDAVAGLLRDAGLTFSRPDRSLFARVRDMPLDVAFLRASDIPVLVAEGAVDLGVTGSDAVEESGVDLVQRMALGLGHCRRACCVPEASPIKTPGDLDGARIATSYPRATARYLAQLGVSGHVVELSGSIEVMISVGVADAIVDIVETGSTLAANRLRILDEISQHETVLVQQASPRDPQLCDRVVRRLEGIVIARSYSMLEYNVRKEKLAAAEALTPGFESPTISKLEEAGWFSVRAMVKRSDVVDTMERLESLGATAILETAISNCRL
ncbi:MAG TPA: ATP phosphoribosyltransferase [Candidatus Latescibacteria bacterium]|jgi:ATP phosphoribosyltransferase|nr:ATP phosphoribosyltransferase [Candidatus Latescibacterota bacterium]HJP29445.1 ATP phosphoribosyltransferase [Candidatus Latescibacterota bacterium]